MGFNSSENNYVIGTSYYACHYNFINPVGITAYIPHGVKDFPRSLICKHLVFPGNWYNKLVNANCGREEFEVVYREYISITVPDMAEFLDSFIEQWGPNPVFLGMKANPNSCHRSILAKIIQEQTNYEVREVKEQCELYDIDLNTLIQLPKHHSSTT